MALVAPIDEWLKLGRAVSSEVSVRSTTSDDVEIALVQSGALHREIVGGKIFVPKDHVLVVPRDERGTTTVMTSKHGVALWLSEDLIVRIEARLDMDPGVRTIDASFIVRHRRVEALLQFLIDEVAEAAGAYTDVAETICESIVVELLDSTLNVGRSTALRDPRVRSVIRSMRAAESDLLTVQDLANHVKMSRFELTRLFRDDVGETPYPFLVRLRAARRAALVREARSA